MLLLCRSILKDLKRVKDIFPARAEGTGWESLLPWRLRVEEHRLKAWLGHRVRCPHPGNIVTSFVKLLKKKRAIKDWTTCSSVVENSHTICKALCVKDITGSRRKGVGGRERRTGGRRNGGLGGKEETRWKQCKEKKYALRAQLLFQELRMSVNRRTLAGRNKVKCSKYSGGKLNRLWQWISGYCWRGKWRKVSGFWLL